MNSHGLEAFYQVLLKVKCFPFGIAVIATKATMKTKPSIGIVIIVIAVNLGYSIKNALFGITIAIKYPWAS